jgi:3-hydroxyisobutyrate dehydrogenase
MPPSGGVVKAVAGTLAIMFGGDDAAWQRAQPVLACMGEALFRCGAVGAGHATKALNNYLYGTALMATAEALHMGAKLGLDLTMLTQVINASSGRNVVTETKTPAMIGATYTPSFQLGLMRKDLATAAAIADETGEPARALRTVLEGFTGALEALGPKVDSTEIHRYLGLAK